MLRFLLIASTTLMLPLGAQANSTTETKENDSLDLMDGNMLVQGKGVSRMNEKACAEGLKFPALVYWSPEGHYFITPAPGDCNGAFKKQKASITNYSKQKRCSANFQPFGAFPSTWS